MNRRVRKPAVAGIFYPANPEQLRVSIVAYLASARSQFNGNSIENEARKGLNELRALVLPHAGHEYSGQIAAAGYALLAREPQPPRRIALFGPAHRSAFDGLCLPESGFFATPLGELPVDEAARAALSGHPSIITSDTPHAFEHCLEVQLPFIQSLYGEMVPIMPILTGRCSADTIAKVMLTLSGLPGTLILVSTDLSHYLPKAEAEKLDAVTVSKIGNLDPSIRSDMACGASALDALLLVAKKLGFTATCLALGSSADSTKDETAVVGYTSFAFHARAHGAGNGRQSDDSGRIFPDLARKAIREVLDSRLAGTRSGQNTQHEHAKIRDRKKPDPGSGEPETEIRARAGSELSMAGIPDHLVRRLEEPGASFVTLTLAGNLRGCIGSLEPRRPLALDIKENAEAAAFRDPRFKALTEAEFNQVRIEVSILSIPEPIHADSEEKLVKILVPGRDGVILEYGMHRATYLPQVWEQLPDPCEFIASLKIKAGLSPRLASPEFRWFRYTVEKWSEA